jgi:hypothetical protein
MLFVPFLSRDFDAPRFQKSKRNKINSPEGGGVDESQSYPAREPPTQGIMTGAKAGALPALTLATSDVGVGGDGLFRIAIYFVSGRRGA